MRILQEFVKECSKELDLLGVLQFGSSTYSKDAQDIDLIFFSKDDIASASSFLKLIKIMKNFENRYSDVVFDLGGLGRKRKAKQEITVVFLGLKELNVKHNPHDIFFYKNLIEGKNKKMLFGKNPFQNTKLKLTNKHIFELLSVDMKHALRLAFDDKDEKFKAIYHLFKTVLRVMLINDGVFKKEELPKRFKEKYPNISLPKNSEKISTNKINEKDFEDILKFTEDCLRYLTKG